MPKRSRQAHVPQQVRRRKARRQSADGRPLPEAPGQAKEPVFADPPIANLPHMAAVGAVDTRPQMEARRRRRLELVRGGTEAVAGRTIPGQLPTFDRSYLVHELRQILLTAGSLLAVIIVLALVLR